MQLLPGIGRGRACKCIYQRMRCMRESKRRSGKKILLSTILKPSERLNTHTESHQQIIIITLPINSTTTLLSQWHSLSFKLPRFAAVVCFGLIELSNMLYYASNMCAHIHICVCCVTYLCCPGATGECFMRGTDISHSLCHSTACVCMFAMQWPATTRAMPFDVCVGGQHHHHTTTYDLCIFQFCSRADGEIVAAVWLTLSPREPKT